MESCEICGAECESEYCEDCQYRIESGDNSDIFERVQLHSNLDYQIDQVKIAICKHFGIDDFNKTGRKKPNVIARQLFVYALLTRFNMRIRDICQLIEVTNCDVIYIRKKWDKKMSFELTRKKFEGLINIL